MSLWYWLGRPCPFCKDGVLAKNIQWWMGEICPCEAGQKLKKEKETNAEEKL